MKRYLCPVLIGRSEQLDALLEALRAVAGGAEGPGPDRPAAGGSAHFLIGEAGVGKTRLAREAIAEARSLGLTVLHGRAVDAHDAVAFRPLTEALFSYFRDVGPPDVPALEPFRPALGRLVPEWRQPGATVPNDSLVVLAEAVLRLLRVVGDGRGCLLFLDDLHWADPDTLAILRYLTQNISSEPVVCLGALRPEDGPAARELVSTLVAQRAASELRLDNLDPAGVAAMARACLDVVELPAALADLVAEHADGLPYLVEELLAGAANAGSLVETGDGWTAKGPLAPALPLTLVDSVEARLTRLGDPAATVVVTASVLGRQFDWRLLPAVTGLDELAVLSALRAGVDAQLLQAEPTAPNAFRFRHALTRDAVLRRLLPVEREVLSRRALAEVVAAHPDLPGEWCVLAAGLAQAAGDLPRAAELLVRSGHQARALGALAGAAGTFERARQLTDVPAMVADAAEGLCETLVLMGDYDRARAVGTELLDLLADLGTPPDRAAAVHLRLARAAVTAGDADTADQHLVQARGLAATDDLAAVTAHADAVEASVATSRGEFDRADQLATRALGAAERLGLYELRCEALEEIGRVARTHDAEEAERAFESALEVATEHGLVPWRIRALFELCTIDMYLARSADRMIATRDLAASSGALATAAQVDFHLAHWCVDRFELERSIESARRSNELARRFHMDELLAAGLVAEATACGRLGRREEMEALLREALAITDAPTLQSVAWGHCRAMSSLVAENQRQALRELDTAMDILRREPSTVFYPERGLWALLHAVHGPDGEAACAEVRASGATTARLVRGYLHLAEAVLHGRAGRADQAAVALAEGDTALAPVDWLRHHARRLVAEAAIRDGWGDPVTWLNQALVVFEDRQQDRLAAACRSLLRKAGAPVPRRAAASGSIPGPLRELGVTGREFEVLTLLADGLSNKEIASRLFFSPRTVERHVANLSAKSGRATRSELVAFAVRATGD